MYRHKGTLTSLQLHLAYPADAVVRVPRVRDVANGWYGAFCAEDRGALLIAHGLAPLLRELGSFQPNASFHPTWVDSPGRGPSGPETADLRVTQLSAFETRWPGGSACDFAPTQRLKDPDEIARRVAEHMSGFTHWVERRYRDAQHIVCVGHLDSRLILLTPKLHPKRWHIYAQKPPGIGDVQRWLDEARVRVAGRFFNAGQFRKDRQHFDRLVDANDGRCLPLHWICEPLSRFAAELGGRVIVWAGGWGDGLHARSPSLAGGGYRHFWQRLRRHQQPRGAVGKRMTGCAYLSIYHSPEIWRELYQHYDPRACAGDIRPLIGRELLGRDVPPCRNRSFPVAPRLSVPRKELFRGYLLRLGQEMGTDESAIRAAWPWAWVETDDSTPRPAVEERQPRRLPGTSNRAATARVRLARGNRDWPARNRRRSAPVIRK